MVAALEKSYRWTLHRIFSAAALIVALCVGKTVTADSVVNDPEAVAKVFSDVGVDTEEIKRSHNLSGACFSTYAGEPGYYSQPLYYSQASYDTTFTTAVVERQDFTIFGTLSKGAGTFVIDHPLDPKNRLLYHSFVESPDVKNWYDGVATLNTQGEARVRLPSYFMALNTDFRYQLKPIGTPQPGLFVKNEIVDNYFVIGGGVPGAKVSWQVTGNRKDPYIIANPIQVDVTKGPSALVNRDEMIHDDIYPRSLISLIGRGFAWMRSLF